jgi:ABC-2 type transport system permease protein
MARHNLRTVVRFEVLRTLGKRRFWVATLIVPVALIVVGLLVSSSSSATDAAANAQRSARLHFAYTDASGLVDASIAARAGGTRAESTTAGIAAVRSGRLDAFFAYPASPSTQHIRVYGADKGVFGNDRYAAAAEQLLKLSVQQRIGSPGLAAIAAGDVTTTTTTFTGSAVSAGLGAVVPPLLYLVLFYLIILLLGNQMLSSLLEEKENRVTEMILTTIKPTNLIIGKVVSLYVVGLVQILVFAIPAMVGYAFFRTSLQLPDLDLHGLELDPQRMIIGGLILLGGFALFTGTLVALGAAMPTAKDAGPLFAITMVLTFVPFYVISQIVSDPTAPIVQLFSFFPWSAPITTLLRNAFGSLPLWQGVVVIVELFALSAIALRIAARIFRYGSIEYSRKVDLRVALSARPAAATTATATPEHGRSAG